MPWPSAIRVGGVRNLVTRPSLAPQPSPPAPAEDAFSIPPAWAPAPGTVALLAADGARPHLLPVWLAVRGLEESLPNDQPSKVSYEHLKVCEFIDHCDEFGTFDVPREFICPVSLHAMRCPVVASDGITYERESAASAMLKRPGISPLTNGRLESCRLFPNHALVTLMAAWAKERGGL